MNFYFPPELSCHRKKGPKRSRISRQEVDAIGTPHDVLMGFLMGSLMGSLVGAQKTAAPG